MNKEKENKMELIEGDYNNMTFTSRLYDMFAKNTESIKAYIKPGREFWHYDGDKGYRKLKVTYVRSGVMFFVFEDKPEIERAWFLGSFSTISLYAAQIYPYEIGKLLSSQSKLFKDYDKRIPEICRQCNWEDCDGNINVEVIWEHE